jgi:hypothetical protein
MWWLVSSSVPAQLSPSQLRHDALEYAQVELSLLWHNARQSGISTIAFREHISSTFTAEEVLKKELAFIILISRSAYLRPWRRKWYVPPKRRLPFIALHGDTSQMTELFTRTAVRTQNSTETYVQHVPLVSITCTTTKPFRASTVLVFLSSLLIWDSSGYFYFIYPSFFCKKPR